MHVACLSVRHYPCCIDPYAIDTPSSPPIYHMPAVALDGATLMHRITYHIYNDDMSGLHHVLATCRDASLHTLPYDIIHTLLTLYILINLNIALDRMHIDRAPECDAQQYARVQHRVLSALDEHVALAPIVQLLIFEYVSVGEYMICQHHRRC